MRLAEYLARKKLSAAKFADRIGHGCTASAITKLRRGERSPSIARAYEIEVASEGKVKLKDWFPDGLSRRGARKNERPKRKRPRRRSPPPPLETETRPTL